MIMTQGQLFILSAPSGAGKTTVVKQLMLEIDNLVFSVSHTTRPPREGEIDGVSYYFIDKEEFQAMIDRDEFLEYAEVHGNYYGTSKKAVYDKVAAGFDIILDIDVQGTRILVHEKQVQGVTVFLAPPDVKELEKRLKSRGTDDAATIATRLENAKEEMRALDEYEYLIVNDTIADAVSMLKAVVLAERARSRRGLNGKPLPALGEV